MRILFLNQYFPPDPAPTGILLKELGDYFQSQGHTVDYISSRQNYRSAKKNRKRLLREVVALGSMFIEGLKAPHADVIFSASSPPCLPVVATLLAGRHGAKSVHWAMDLYPELAVALGELKPGIIPTMVEKLMAWAYRRASIVAALDEDMAARLKKHGVDAAIVSPWVLGSFPAPATPVEPDPQWTWIYSGNLGRAHEWETLLQAQALLEKRGLPCRLLFQGGGPSRPLAQARAVELKLRQCDWKEYAPEAELQASLLRCRVLAVTQKPETRGLLWPSKLALACALPRPILWVGPDGAIAQTLRQIPGSGVFAPGEAEQVADWLQKRHAESAQPAERKSRDTARDTLFSLQKWSGLLDRLNP